MIHHGLEDSAADAIAVQSDLYRQMTSDEKAHCLRNLCMSANTLALAGLRRRHPGATERELLLRLAVLRLGEEHVFQAYGWQRPDGT